MNFRRRYWYTPGQLAKYSEQPDKIEQALKVLHKAMFLKTDEDCLYETDYERIHELFECMVMPQVKQVEDELRKTYKGQFASVCPTLYDCISNNPFHVFKVADSESTFHNTCSQLSNKTSQWVRIAAENAFAQGKKVNPFMNYQVTDKVKLIFRLMQRVIQVLGPPTTTADPQNTLSLLDFLSVCKGINSAKGKTEQPVSVREKMSQVFYAANENS